MPSSRARSQAGVAVAACLVAALAAGCGSGRAATKTGTTDKSDDGGYVARTNLGWCPEAMIKMPSRAQEMPSRVFQPLHWVEAKDIALVSSEAPSGGAGLVTARLTDPVAFVAKRPVPTVPTLTIPQRWLAKARDAIDAKGRTLVVAFDDEATVKFIADHWESIHRVSFIGDCAYRDLTDPLDQYVFAHAAEFPEEVRPEVELLRQLLADPRGKLARDFATFLREHEFE